MFLCEIEYECIGYGLYKINEIKDKHHMHHFVAIGEFNLRLKSGNAQFGSKSAIFCPERSWNLADDLKKQYGTSPNVLQAVYIIS